MTRTYIAETGWTPVQANGLTHAVLITGQGPLVILQHGFPDTAHTWSEVAPRLVEAGYRVACPFGRGIAPSEQPVRDAYHVLDIGQDIVDLIPALGAETAVVVGHDWGASAVWAAAHLAPERISKLVAVAIPHPAAIKVGPREAYGSRHFLSNKMPWAARRFRRNDFAELRTMYERWSPGFDWPESEFTAAKNAYTAPGSLHAAMGYYRRLGLWPLRGRVSCDTLVIGGLTDGVLTPEQFERSRARVTGSCDVKMLPGGHFLHREHPEPFIEALLSFLGPATPA